MISVKNELHYELMSCLDVYQTSTTIIPENEKATGDLYFDHIEFVRKGTVVVQLSRRPTRT